MTVFFDVPVMRTVARMLHPSQSARTMADRLTVLNLYTLVSPQQRQTSFAADAFVGAVVKVSVRACRFRSGTTLP